MHPAQLTWSRCALITAPAKRARAPAPPMLAEALSLLTDNSICLLLGEGGIWLVWDGSPGAVAPQASSAGQADVQTALLFAWISSAQLWPWWRRTSCRLLVPSVELDDISGTHGLYWLTAELCSLLGENTELWLHFTDWFSGDDVRVMKERLVSTPEQ